MLTTRISMIRSSRKLNPFSLELPESSCRWNPNRKQFLFVSKQRSCGYCYMNAPHGRSLNGWRKSLTAIKQECCEQYWKSPGDSTSQNSSYTTTNHPLWKLSKLDQPDARDTAGVVKTSSWVMYSCGPLHMNEQRQDVPFEPTYSNSVPIRDVAQRIYRKQWTIGGVARDSQEYPCWYSETMIYIYIYIYTHNPSA